MDCTIRIISGMSTLNGPYDPHNFWNINPLFGRAGGREDEPGGDGGGPKKYVKSMS